MTAAILGLSLALLMAGPAAGAPNLLLIVLDDVGTDGVGYLGEHPDPPATPTIDALAASGVVFDRAWANPVCTPSRASIMLGQYAHTSGVTGRPDDTPMPPGAHTIAHALRDGGYATWAVGKWHLAQTSDPATHPHTLGFDFHAGTRANIIQAEGGYYDFPKWIDGVEGQSTRYATLDTTDDAIQRIAITPEPWFGYVAYNAAHKPWVDPPPTGMYSQILSTPPTETEIYRAMIEAVDTDLARLLASVPPDTYIFLLGDNGPPRQVVTPPTVFDRVKGTPYEGGIRVPFVAAGPGIVPGISRRNIHVADLYATLLEIAGLAPVAPADSRSILPLMHGSRSPIHWFVFSERFRGDRAAKRGCYKMLFAVGESYDWELYDICEDPFELDNIADGPMSCEQKEHYSALYEALEGTPSPLAPCASNCGLGFELVLFLALPVVWKRPRRAHR